MTEAPAGFHLIDVGGEYIRVNGPLWLFRDGTDVRLGFRVEPRHTNGMLICHGGMMATFCDMLLPLTARSLVAELEGNFLPTINLQVDYIAPSRIGEWVEGQAQVLKFTRRMVFMQGLVTADGALVARTSGMLKVGRKSDDSGGAATAR
jgi:uncharacterized protein (TIGR00369 family)